MAERPPEQEAHVRRLAESLIRATWDGSEEPSGPGIPDSYRLWVGYGKEVARAYLALLAAYEDRSKAFERAAADCVRLEGEHARLREALGGLAWLDNNRLNYGSREWLSLFDAAVADARAALSSAEAGPVAADIAGMSEEAQHALAEHLREAREHQEEKHGE